MGATDTPAENNRAVSPSAAMMAAGEAMMRDMADGFKRAEERRAAGLPPEPISAETIAFAGRVARRSFWALYEDEPEALAD
jgi:hypothetical protein